MQKTTKASLVSYLTKTELYQVIIVLISLLKKDTSGNITDVIINESKQVSNAGSISLSSGVSGCGGCTQMSDDWIQYTINRMNSSGNNNLIQLASDIENFGLPNVTQIVSGVNKNTRKLVILNITGF